MKNGKAETIVQNGELFIRFEDLLQGLYAVVKESSAIAERSPADFATPDFLNKIDGMIALCLGLEELQSELKKREGLL